MVIAIITTTLSGICIMGYMHSTLARWRQFFPSRQIKVLLFDDLKNNAEDFYNDIAEFLGVEAFSSVEQQPLDNRTVLPKNKLQKFFWWMIEAPHPLKLFLKRYLNNNF